MVETGSESRSIGLVQKCGGNGVVSPDHCATLVRTSRIFMMKVFFPVLEIVKILQLVGHVTRKSERPMRGSCTSTWITPFSGVIHRGESSSCSWPAACSFAYCSGVGSCGDPISFHTV